MINFFSKIWSFISTISIESVQFLGWTTAVIGALLALTTIIFSQYNDKLVHRANEISKKIKDQLISENKVINEIILNYNEMVASLTNQAIYKNTLILFQVVSFSSGVIWLISGIGYANTRTDLTTSDKYVVYAATLLIVITFIFLPIVIKGFNNNQPIKVNKKNTVNIADTLEYLESSTLNKITILKDILNPKFTFSLDLDFKKNISVNYNQSIVAANIVMVLELVSSENTILIKINNNSNDNLQDRFQLISSNKKENDFTGLFSLINTNFLSRKVYIFKNNNEYLGCYKLMKSAINSNEIMFEIDEYFHSSIPDGLREFLNSKYHLKLNNKKQYKLIKKK